MTTGNRRLREVEGATGFQESEPREALTSEDIAALDALASPQVTQKTPGTRAALDRLAGRMISDLEQAERELEAGGRLTRELEDRAWEARNSLLNLQRKNGQGLDDPAWENSQWSNGLKAMAAFAPEYGCEAAVEAAEELAGWSARQGEYNLNILEECFTPENALIAIDPGSIERLLEDLPFIKDNGYPVSGSPQGKHIIGDASPETEALASTVTAYVDPGRVPELFTGDSPEDSGERGMLVYAVERVETGAGFPPGTVALMGTAAEEQARDAAGFQGQAIGHTAGPETVRGMNVIRFPDSEDGSREVPPEIKVAAESVTYMDYDPGSGSYNPSGTYRSQAIASIPLGARRNRRMATVSR